MPTITDLLIIGAGPVGLFAAYYAGFRQMSVKIVDSLQTLGGQLTTLYPEKFIYDVAGFPKVLAKDLARNLIDQAMQYNPTLCLGEQVLTLTQDSGLSTQDSPTGSALSTQHFSIVTSRAVHHAKAILIAAGIGAFAPKTLPLPNVSHYEGNGLYYFAAHLEEFRNKRLLIVGGGDSAVDWANTLAGLTSSQTLIHRRDVFRAHEDSLARMKQTPTRILLFHELKSIGGGTRIEWATIYDNRSNQEQTLEIDAALVNIGFESSLGPIKDWGLELEHNNIKVDQTMHTTRPGIFAAGDVATYPGKLKLIATGFAEACTAVNFAKTYLDPNARAFPGHSSEMKR